METAGKAEQVTIKETVQHHEDCLSRFSSAMDSVLATILRLEGNVLSIQSPAPVPEPTPTPPLPASVPPEPVRGIPLSLPERQQDARDSFCNATCTVLPTPKLSPGETWLPPSSRY